MDITSLSTICALCFVAIPARLIDGWATCSLQNREMKLYPIGGAWLDAEYQCQKDGGHLATVRTADDRLCAVHAIEESNQCTPESCGRMWVGLNSLSATNAWHWVGAGNARQEAVVGEGIWSAEQPENPERQRCANWNAQFGVSDDYCNFPEMFICERSIPDLLVSVECDGMEWTYHPLGFNTTYAADVCNQRHSILAPPDRSCINQLFSQHASLEDAQRLETWVNCFDITGNANRECMVIPAPSYSIVVADLRDGDPRPFLCQGDIGSGQDTDTSPAPGSTSPLAKEQLTRSSGTNLGVVAGCGFIGASIAFLVAGIVLYYRRQQRRQQRQQRRLPIHKMEINETYVSSQPRPLPAAAAAASLQRQSSVKTTRTSHNHLTLTLQVRKERRTTTTETTRPQTLTSDYITVPYATSPLSCMMVGRRYQQPPGDDTQPYRVRQLGAPMPPATQRPKLDMQHEYAEPLSFNPAYGAPPPTGAAAASMGDNAQYLAPDDEVVQYSYDVPSDE